MPSRDSWPCRSLPDASFRLLDASAAARRIRVCPDRRSGQQEALGIRGIASVRLAYGYAQYDYPQCRSFVFITDAPAALAIGEQSEADARESRARRWRAYLPAASRRSRSSARPAEKLAADDYKIVDNIAHRD